jgi:hypothetical protein
VGHYKLQGVVLSATTKFSTEVYTFPVKKNLGG